MKVTIYNWRGNAKEFEVGNLKDIKVMIVHIVTGDEILLILYKNGDKKDFDSDEFNTRMEDYSDGFYPLYDPDDNVNFLGDEKFLALNDSYKRQKYVWEKKPY